MDRQQEIEKMAFSICPMPQIGEYITDCSKCGYNGDCPRQKYAKKLIEKGYGNVQAAVEDVAERIKKGIFCELADDLTFKMVSRIEAIIEEILKISY